MGKDNVSGEVARLMNAGRSPEQIAKQLDRNLNQIRTYVAGISFVLDGTMAPPILTPTGRDKAASHIRALIDMCSSPEMVAEQQYLVNLLAELESRP